MSDASGRPAFAHASEAELARILDFYEVRWEYEPHVFPLLWNLDGTVVESFSPDFYLPDLDLYVELTTLKQRLVRRKNRKLRRIRELYPDVRIKLFYARDFRALMLKYGKLAILNELSGTSGQVMPAGVEKRRPRIADRSNTIEPPTGSAVEPLAMMSPVAAPLAITAEAAKVVSVGPVSSAATESGTRSPRSRSRRRRAARAARARAARAATFIDLPTGMTLGAIDDDGR